MNTPAPTPQDTPAPRGTVRGHILKKALPGGETQDEGWKVLQEGGTETWDAGKSCLVVSESDPFSGDQNILVVFSESGELTGPLRYRPAPEHSAAKLIRAAKRRQRVRTLAALLVALGWMAGTAYYAITWMMTDHYGWVAAGLVMSFFSIFQIKTAGWGLLESAVDLFRAKLPQSAPLMVTMAQPEAASQAA